MTREQAINYLKSSGMSEEQIETVVDAFTCEDCISRKAALAESQSTFKKAGYGIVSGVFEYIPTEAIRKLPSVMPEGVTITDFADKCRECGKIKSCEDCRTELHGSDEFFNFDSPMAKGENDNES